MTDENRRAILPREHTQRRIDRFRQSSQRVLHCGHVQSGCLQSRNDFGPARSVGKKTMYQHDIFRFRHWLRVSRWSVYVLIHANQLRTIKIGRRRLVSREALNECVAQLAKGAA